MFTTRDRPVRSVRGWSAAPVRHGVSDPVGPAAHPRPRLPRRGLKLEDVHPARRRRPPYRSAGRDVGRPPAHPDLRPPRLPGRAARDRPRRLRGTASSSPTRPPPSPPATVPAASAAPTATSHGKAAARALMSTRHRRQARCCPQRVARRNQIRDPPAGGDLPQRDLLGRDELPTAVVTGHDQQAAGLLQVLSRAGVAIPGRISVTGFGDGWPARLLLGRPDDRAPGPGADGHRGRPGRRAPDRPACSPPSVSVVEPWPVVRGSTARPPAC